MSEKIKKIKIELPEDTAYELLSLVDASCDTGNIEFDNHMTLIKKRLNFQLNR